MLNIFSILITFFKGIRSIHELKVIFPADITPTGIESLTFSEETEKALVKMSLNRSMW